MGILDEAVALAGVDPRALHAQLTTGQPERTVQLARAFEDAGREARDGLRAGQAGARVDRGRVHQHGVPVLDADGAERPGVAAARAGRAGHGGHRAAS